MHCSTRYLIQCPAGRNSPHGQDTAPHSIGVLRPDGHHDIQSRLPLAPEGAAELAAGLTVKITGHSGRVGMTQEIVEDDAHIASIQKTPKASQGGLSFSSPCRVLYREVIQKAKMLGFRYVLDTKLMKLKVILNNHKYRCVSRLSQCITTVHLSPCIPC